MQSTRPFDENGFKVYDLSKMSPVSSSIHLCTEVVLLAWLVVLCQTSETGEASFEWAFRTDLESNEDDLDPRKLSTAVVPMDERTSVDDARSQITQRALQTQQSKDHCSHELATITLSTASLAQKNDSTNFGGTLHLQIFCDHGRLGIYPAWQSDDMLQYSADRYMSVLAETVQSILSNPQQPVAGLLRPTRFDLDSIWSWNHDLPPTYDYCMHEAVSEQARKTPQKFAVESWDGNLTYAEIDERSTRLAGFLRRKNVKLHDRLPVCFEKSRWAAIAVLATMKVGATLVMMDSSLPLARLQDMARQTGAELILSSEKQRDLSEHILSKEKVVIVGEEMLGELTDQPCSLPQVPPDTIMYIIFTSGSTGSPKGVMISHRTYTSSAIPRAREVRYVESSRVLDFASYAFDVSIDSMLLTFANGGCLCIPSDEERMNDVNGAMKRLQVTYAGITPSLARVLDTEVIESLEGLGLGGEAVSATDVTLWGEMARIIIGYGPCECTIGCTINGSAATGRNYVSIGKGNGAAMWIVDPDDTSSLVAVGATGELLVEGPIVGQGYLNDSEKTKAAFIEDPPWLTNGHADYHGRRGRLYKTGDLGKYDPDGSGGIVFVGRKDTQVKLRGQRVELGEIESQLRARLPNTLTVIAETISAGSTALVVFVAPSSVKDKQTSEIATVEMTTEDRKAMDDALADLAQVLPRYMIPTTYIPINRIPVLVSGKTDRKNLRAFGSSLHSKRSEDEQPKNNESRESSEVESRLRQAWAQVLDIQGDSILAGDNFFVIGGDSLAAMKLISACKTHSISLTVADVFRNPTLAGMAGVAESTESDTTSETPAFSLVSRDQDVVRREAAEACRTDFNAVEDVYPCTPTQEGLFTLSLRSQDAYIAQRVARIPPHITLDAWKAAWETVVAATPILRTRLAQLEDRGLQQVVLSEPISWVYPANIASYLESDREEKVELGKCLARYALVDEGGQWSMIWTIHHTLYDGWSEPFILQRVSDALKSSSISSSVDFKEFVRYTVETDADATREYWKQELEGAGGSQFPILASRDYLPNADSILERQISLKDMAGSPFTLPTVIRGAWALVASQYTNSDDVIFGETLTGRDIALANAESIIGPLITTIPIRIRIDRADSSVEKYLQGVQQSMMARNPHQHMGWQYIRKVSEDAQYASEAPTGLVFQPEPERSGEMIGFEVGDAVREALHFNPYPLMAACGVRKDGFRVCASFDSTVISAAQMDRTLAQLERTCQQLISNRSAPISEIDCLPLAEYEQILRWNSEVHTGALTPWVCRPGNTSMLSPIGCVGQLVLEGERIAGDVPAPKWLQDGSSDGHGRSGNVHATGDLVRLCDDGSIKFVGRKDDQQSQSPASTAQPNGNAESSGAEDESKSKNEDSLTPAQAALQSSWAEVLGVSTTQIHKDDNFFRVGGDSVLAMKVVSNLRAKGHELTVGDVFRHMRLDDAAEVLKLDQKAKTGAQQKYQPFSTVKQPDVENFVEKIVRPKLHDPSWSIQDVCPAADSQIVDVVGTIRDPRTSIQHTLLYVDEGVDKNKLKKASASLIEACDILRTVFVEHDVQTFQVVVERLDLPLDTQRVETLSDDAIKKICQRDLADSDLKHGKPFTNFILVEGEDSRICLILRLSHAQYDAVSFPAMLRMLSDLYQGGPVAPIQFPAYIAHTQAEPVREKAISYWRNLLQGSSLSRIDVPALEAGKAADFKSARVDVSKRVEGTTVATVLTAAWAVVLARRLGVTDVTFGNITGGRAVDVPDVLEVVGPCYQFTPVRVPFATGWTAADLLDFVQKQIIESSAYDFLGFSMISKECAPWPAELKSFPSIVDHQDASEDFETMPFADGSCRVEALNLHGYSADPLKVISFAKEGQHVGIVGSASDPALLDALLADLARAISDLIDKPSEKVPI